MKLKRKAFKWMNAAEDVEGIGDFNNFIDGINETDPAAMPEVETPEADPAQTQEQNPDVNTQGTPAEDAGDEQLPLSGKASATFAQMRVAQKKQQQVMQRLLQRIGVDASLASNPEQLAQLLDEADTSADAERMNVPSEVLTRLQFLEKEHQKSEQERNYQTALLGFTNLQNELGLDKKDVQTFAQQLMQDGVDPFTSQVDLKKEFVARNYTLMIQRATEKAVQEALSKETKAAQHSTQPAAKSGRPATTVPTEKINTQGQLSKLLLDLER